MRVVEGGLKRFKGVLFSEALEALRWGFGGLKCLRSLGNFLRFGVLWEFMRVRKSFGGLWQMKGVLRRAC